MTATTTNRILPDPVQDALTDAAENLRSIDLRKVKGDQRDRIKAAREAVAEALRG